MSFGFTRTYADQGNTWSQSRNGQKHALLQQINRTLWGHDVTLPYKETDWSFWPPGENGTFWGLHLKKWHFTHFFPSPSPITWPRGSLGHHRWFHNQFSPFFSVFRFPLGLGELQACPFPDVVFPPLFLSALSFPFTVSCKMVLARPDERELVWKRILFIRQSRSSKNVRSRILFPNVPFMSFNLQTLVSNEQQVSDCTTRQVS